jgi:hypothetical protein
MSESPFLEALKKSVGRARASFDDADRDLHSAVVEADNAVKEISRGRLSLGLDAVDDAVHGRIYDLDLSEMGNLVQTIESYFVPQSGYPISYGPRQGRTIETRGKLDSTEELTSYLLEMMSAPNSPLTVALAFRLRASV